MAEYTRPRSSTLAIPPQPTTASQHVPRRLPVLEPTPPVSPIPASGAAANPPPRPAPGPQPIHPAGSSIAVPPAHLKRKREDDNDGVRRNFGLMWRWVDPAATPPRPAASQPHTGSPAPPRPTVVVPQTSAALPPAPPLSPKSKEREEEYFSHAQKTYEWIKNVEETQGGTVVRQMIVSRPGSDTDAQAREQFLLPIDGDTVRNAIYELLNAPNQTISFPALRSVAQSVGQGPLEHDSIVDDQGNPYTEYILTFIDVFLVLFRPVSTTMIPLKAGIGQSGENDETDQKAFGALAATSLASRILILIPHAHHHVLRAVWLGLTFLSASYGGSKRGVAVKFLLDRLAEEWTTREEKRAKEGAVAGTEEEKREARVQSVWLRRAKGVDELRQLAEKRTRSGVSLATIWAEMKGLGEGMMVRAPLANGMADPRGVARPAGPPQPRVRPPLRPDDRSPPRSEHPSVPSQTLHSLSRQFVPPLLPQAPGQPAFQPYRTVHLAPEPSIAFRAGPVAPVDGPSPTGSHDTIDSTTPSPKLETLAKGLGVDVPPPGKVPRLGTPVPAKADGSSPRMRISLSPDSNLDSA